MTQAAAGRIAAWIQDPVLFVREVFQTEPDLWQQDVLKAFADPKNKRIAQKASKGVGKSTVLAWLDWYFMVTRPQARVFCTSITADNLSDGLWTELSKWQQRSELLRTSFTWTKTRIVANDHPETWYTSARTWPKSANPTQQADALAGIHGERVLFLCDEAGGYSNAIMATIEAALATGVESRLVIAGNPTHLEGPLYAACSNERHLWRVFEISGDPDDPKRAPRVSAQWAREQIEKYGKENPWVLVNVYGKFPPASINALLGVDEVNAAMGRFVKDDDYVFAQKRIGVDVARFGDDATVIFPRQGLVAYMPIEMRNARTHDIAARVMLGKSKFGSEMEFIDDTGGYGAGVIDAMLQARENPIPVSFSGKADDSRFFNKRTEMWWRMAEWVKRGGSLPEDPQLVRELTTPTYTFQNGKIRLEEKDQIKERLGFSPDKADALCVTFALPEMPSRMHEFSGVARSQTRSRAATEWDPLSVR